MDHLLEAADHRPDHLLRHLLAAGDFLEQFGDEALEGVERLLDDGDPVGPGRIDLDEAHLRGAGLACDQAEEGLQRLPRPVVAAGPALGGS